MNSSVLKKIVLIGASTGGPGQIQKIITSLPKLHTTSIIIAQHMVDGFMQSFSNRLQNKSLNKISIIANNQSFENANIYVCEGETRLNQRVFSKKATSKDSYNPNINTLFNSFTPLCKDTQILCVILTGIGDDGVEACNNLSLVGARCITESKQSAIVDGMPNRARASVKDIEVHSMEKIVKIISEFCE